MVLNFSNILLLLAIFFFLYNLIFFLIILIENRKKLYLPKKEREGSYPKVCIIVPCLNEEATIVKTVQSLLSLDYPKNKLEIFIIDDGSTDNTYERAKEVSIYKQVKLFNKKNGGKWTALNYGIEKTDAEIIGCLDADSILDPSSLKKIIHYFQDKELMTVATGPKINRPKTIFQHIAQIEFLLVIFARKSMSLIDSIIVIPGACSFYRKEVFEKIGGFKEGHKTEDIEMTLRLQKNNIKIKNALDVSVYTIGQDTFKKLYKQRLRWNTGYLKNIWDYKMLFKKTYGDLSIFLILGIVSISLMIMLVGQLFFNGFLNVMFYFQKALAIDFNLIPLINFELNPLFIDINPFLFLSFISIIAILGMIFLSKKLSFEKQSYLKGILPFILFFPLLMFIFIAASLYFILIKKKIAWR